MVWGRGAYDVYNAKMQKKWRDFFLPNWLGTTVLVGFLLLTLKIIFLLYIFAEPNIAQN